MNQEICNLKKELIRTNREIDALKALIQKNRGADALKVLISPADKLKKLEAKLDQLLYTYYKKTLYLC